jgi:hypothetical protein
MDGICKNCGKPIHWWAKEREYCGDTCRQTMWRKRKDEEKREQREKERMQLQADWRRLQLPPDAVEILKEILLLEKDEHGLKVVQLVTKAIEIHLQCLQKTNEKSQ